MLTEKFEPSRNSDYHIAHELIFSSVLFLDEHRGGATKFANAKTVEAISKPDDQHISIR